MNVGTGKFVTNRKTFMRYHGKGLDLKSLPDLDLILTPMSTSVHQIADFDWLVFIRQKCFSMSDIHDTTHHVGVSFRPSQNSKGFSFTFRHKPIFNFSELYYALDKVAHEGMPAGLLFFGTQMDYLDRPKMDHLATLQKINAESYERVKDFYPTNPSEEKKLTA